MVSLKHGKNRISTNTICTVALMSIRSFNLILINAYFSLCFG